MLKIKKVLTLLSVLAVVLLGACNTNPATSTPPDENIETITVIDSIDREVEVREP